MEYDVNCELLAYKNFIIHRINGDIEHIRERILELAIDIKPDYIEIADYNALGLLIAVNKWKYFHQSCIVTNCHTATREIFMWNTDKIFDHAPDYLKQMSIQEEDQMKKSDYCIAPSTFLARYIERNYNITHNTIKVFANPYCNTYEIQSDIYARLANYYNLEEWKNSFNIALITRFEPRKRQMDLIKSFISLLKHDINANLILAGDTTYDLFDKSDYRYKCYKSIPHQYRSKVFFYDFMDIKEQELIVAITDLIVLPSPYENQPYAMIQAIMSDIPVMASKYSGIADYSDDVLLFDPFLQDNLIHKINAYINTSTDEIIEIQKRQKETLQTFIDPNLSILPRFLL
ncbi:MAG: glycosyltransferase [Desulfovibrio sp.]|nr:glycosyltransferase [Desulfovibrio sp.]